MSEERNAVHELMTSLRQARDELRVRMHLANDELRDEWEVLEDRFDGWKREYEPLKNAVGDSADDAWQSLQLVGEEIRDGFRRIRKSM